MIGIDAYQKFPRLGYAVADAKAVAALLPSLGFPKDNIYILLDAEATKARIESTLYRRLKLMGPNDRLLVYFAGHGETLPIRDGEEGYILPVDADPEGLPPTAIALDDVQRIAKRLPAKHYLFVMDSCFSGFAATRAADAKDISQEYLAAALREPVVQVITAGRKGQRSIEDQGHGLFTRYLLEGLRGSADQDGRGFISAAQLAAWLEPRVVRASKGRMTPQYARVDGEGHFIFTLPGSLARAAPPDLSGTFTGMIQSKFGEREGLLTATVTFLQKGKNLSGTWTTQASSGTMTGIVDGSQIRAFKVFQTVPCPLVLHGSATIEKNRNALSGYYGGRECDGQPLTATFRLSRVERDPKFEDSPLELQDLINIALSYMQQQRDEDALDYFQQALRVAQEKNDDWRRARVQAMIGLTYQKLGRVPDAIDYLEQAVRTAKRIDDVDAETGALNSLGLLHLQLGDPTEAQGYLERGLARAERVGAEAAQARLLYSLGLAAASQERTAEALRAFEKALAIADRLKMAEYETIRRQRDSLLNRSQ